MFDLCVFLQSVHPRVLLRCRGCRFVGRPRARVAFIERPVWPLYVVCGLCMLCVTFICCMWPLYVVRGFCMLCVAFVYCVQGRHPWESVFRCLSHRHVCSCAHVCIYACVCACMPVCTCTCVSLFMHTSSPGVRPEAIARCDLSCE